MIWHIDIINKRSSVHISCEGLRVKGMWSVRTVQTVQGCADQPKGGTKLTDRNTHDQDKSSSVLTMEIAG